MINDDLKKAEEHLARLKKIAVLNDLIEKFKPLIDKPQYWIRADKVLFLGYGHLDPCENLPFFEIRVTPKLAAALVESFEDQRKDLEETR